MRFFLDQDVDAAVGVALREWGHEAWTASEAGLHDATDDELTCYAHDQHAILVTHDKEFSGRRKRNVVGHHIYLRCREEDAVTVLQRWLPSIERHLDAASDLFLRLSLDNMETSQAWE